MRAIMRLVKVASSREMLRGDWFAEDPVLHDLPNLQMRAGTNYKISPELARRLDRTFLCVCVESAGQTRLWVNLFRNIVSM